MSGRSGLWTDDELANRKKRSSLSSSLSLSFGQADRRRLPHSTANDFLSTKTIVACPTRRPRLRSRRGASAPLGLSPPLARSPYVTPLFSLQISFDPVLLVLPFLVLLLSCDNPGRLIQSVRKSVSRNAIIKRRG